MSLIRGVLLAGQFRTHHELNLMSDEDQRNTLIVELANRSNENNFQSFNAAALADAGAALVFLRTARIRTDAELKTMSIDDMRNILIVEIGSMTGMGGELQGMRNVDLVTFALGEKVPASLNVSNFIRGVLLVGQFRTQRELNRMSNDDQRNTLIVELANRSNQRDLQSFNDSELAGMGAILVFLRTARIRTDAQLKTITADDMRNILIVEIDGQTHLGSRLQSLSNMDLVLAGLGVDPAFPVIPPQRYFFKIDSVEIHRQKADNDHSDSDWLTIIVTVANPITKNVQTISSQPIHLEGNIKTGNVITGNFESDVFIAEDPDIVTVSYVLMNLGSSDAERQFAQAVKVTNKIVGIAAPAIGAAYGFFFGSPGEGFKIGAEVAKAIDTAIKTLSDVFDFLGIHFGPPNCNGEVLNDTLTFQSGELRQAVNRPASRRYTGPQEETRCGGAPESTVSFRILRSGGGGIFGPNP